jgi:hypothetical protein
MLHHTHKRVQHVVCVCVCVIPVPSPYAYAPPVTLEPDGGRVEIGLVGSAGLVGLVGLVGG